MQRRSFLAGLASLLAFPSAAKAFVMPDKPENPLLMPYKGRQLHDAGMFYCPYVPISYKMEMAKENGIISSSSVDILV